MSLNQENIIKDKLLDHEVPFEEEYWADFKKKLDSDQAAKPIGGYPWLKTKLFAMAAGLVLVAFLFFKNDIGTNKIASLDNNVSNQEQSISDNSSITNENYNGKNNSSNKNQVNNSDAVVTTNNQNESSDTKNNDISNNTFDSNNKNRNGVNSSSKSEINNQSNSKRNSKKNNRENKANNTTQNNTTTTNGFRVKNNSKNLNGNGVIAGDFNSKNNTSNTSDAAQTGPTGIYAPTPDYMDGAKVLSNIDGVNSGAVNAYTSANTSDVLTSLDKIKNEEIINTFTNDLVALTAMDLPGVDLPRNNRFEPHKGSEEVEWDLPRIKRWEIGGYAGIGLNIPTKYGELAQDYNIKGSPNITAGFYFNYALNKKLSVETALQYKRIVDIFAMRVNFEDGEELIKFTETSIVSRLNSFEIPMGINYKLNDWLYFSTGLSLAYVRPSQDFLEVKEVENLGSSNVEDFYVLANQENYGLRKIDIRAYAGLTFNVSPFIGFKFLINQGLIDRTKNDYYNTNHYNLHTDYTFSTVIRLNAKVLK